MKNKAIKIFLVLLITISLFLLLLKQSKKLYAETLCGQIIVDPENSSWLVYNRDADHDGKLDPFYMCGPGDPEDFLYRGKRNADGTRKGDQVDLIQKLIEYGGNCIYMQIIRSHGGDGDDDHNPFINSNPQKNLNEHILAQWEEWFTLMDENNIVIFLFFYDDDARIWETEDVICVEEKKFIKKIVNRFKHHKNLIWCIAEEYPEEFSKEQITNIAAVIKVSDENNHVVAVHHNDKQAMAFYDNPDINQYAMQFYNPLSAEENHKIVVDSWKKSRKWYNLNFAEQREWGTGEVLRKKNWACGMGGAHVMILLMKIKDTPIEDLRSCRIQQSFFESTDFNTMEPHDELAFEDTQYVLADPGRSYIIYSSSVIDLVGLKNMTAGIYTFKWIDCITGKTVIQKNLKVNAGDISWNKPELFSNETAVWIYKVNR